ncbi:MAG: hypothetical protein QM602_09275 [Microbacterium sp.]
MSTAETTSRPTDRVEEPLDALGDSVVTHHSIHSVAGTLAYTATAGRMVIREEAFENGAFQGNRPRAHVFVSSYVLEAPEDERDARPVTFVFNGGPGSPTVWLQFGLLGPHLIRTGDVGAPVPPPYGLDENAESLLIDSDLVFIDPMTTGFSRAAVGTDPTPFHGYSGDRDLVSEAIRLWTTQNERWLSPKFIAGESYGTTRAAAIVARLLRRYGMSFNGVILLSSILDFRTVFFSEGNDEPFIHFLPTFAATAHYHGFHEGRELRELLEEVQEFADTDYRIALARGSRLSSDARSRIAERIASYTGLSAAFVESADLRVTDQKFFAELLRSRELVTGRLDTRFTMYPGRRDLSAQAVDPALEFIYQPYATAANHYFRAVLGYRTDLGYELMAGRTEPWSYREFENASVTSAEDLAAAMRSNPDLKVYLANGFYDASTPYAAAENVFAHLRIAPDDFDRIIAYYYEAGHMMYVHEPSRIAQSRHIREFVAWATGGPRPVVPSTFAFHDVPGRPVELLPITPSHP